jgi:hypothetical protein
MPEKYYTDTSLVVYAQKAIVERVLLYFSGILYPDEDYVTKSSKRFILADVSDDSNAIRRSIDRFKNSQGEFPFTAYSINDDAPLDYKSHLQVNGNFYSELAGAYLSFVPVMFDLFFTTYFTTPTDFWYGMSLFALDESCLTRLDVPVIINGVSCYFPVDLQYTTERGNLAFDIEQQFQVGKMYPVVHNVSVKAAYIVLANNNNSPGTTNQGTFTRKIVYPVDDIILYLNTLNNAHNLDQNNNISTSYSPEIPVVSSCTPALNATNVSRTSDITITFNVGMDEDSVISNMDIVPYMDRDMVFDNDSKILTITPRDILTASTEYSILINNNASSADDIYMEEDFELIFTTGLS